MVNNVISGSHNLFGNLEFYSHINSLIYIMMLDDIGTMQDTAIGAHVLLLCPAVRRLPTFTLSSFGDNDQHRNLLFMLATLSSTHFDLGRDKNSSVGVLIMQRSGGPRNRGLIPNSGNRFCFFFRASIRFLGPNRLPIQRVPAALYPPQKQQERQVCHSFPSNARR